MNGTAPVYFLFLHPRSTISGGVRTLRAYPGIKESGMATVSWSTIEPYVLGAFAQQGRVERADVIDLAYDDNANDDVIDVIDAIGSRVFKTPDDVRAFLQSQNLITA